MTRSEDVKILTVNAVKKFDGAIHISEVQI